MTQTNLEALTKLANALKNLQLAQADVREAYENLSSNKQNNQVPDIIDEVTFEEFELSSVEESSSSESSQSSQSSEALGETIEGTPFRIGNQVKIRNPRPNQQSGGIVLGKTKGKSFFIKVRTPNGDIVLRKSFNLEIINGDQNGRKRKSTHSRK